MLSEPQASAQSPPLFGLQAAREQTLAVQVRIQRQRAFVSRALHASASRAKEPVPALAEAR